MTKAEHIKMWKLFKAPIFKKIENEENEIELFLNSVCISLNNWKI